MVSSNPRTPRSVLHLHNIRTIAHCVIGRMRRMCHLRNIGVGSGRVRIVIHRVLHGTAVIGTNDSSFLRNRRIRCSHIGVTGHRLRTGNGINTACSHSLLNVAGTSLTARSFVSTTSFRRAAHILARTTITNGHSRLHNLGRGIVINHLVPTNANCTCRRSHVHHHTTNRTPTTPRIATRSTSTDLTRLLGTNLNNSSGRWSLVHGWHGGPLQQIFL